MNKPAAQPATPLGLKTSPKRVEKTKPQIERQLLGDSYAQRNVFLVMALNMSWQLAIVVLLPVIAGVFVDRGLHTAPIFLLVGLTLAVIGTIVVLWRTMQVANRLPVPKLTETERRAVQKRYEEDDD